MSCFCSGSSKLSKAIKIMNSKERHQPSVSSEDNNNESNLASLRNPNTDLYIKRFTYQELADATENFSRKWLINVGGFTELYKGKLRETEEIIAVEHFNSERLQEHTEFLVQVKKLACLCRPSNLIQPVGYCFEEDGRFIVHEYPPLQTLEHVLHDRSSKQKPLDWDTRMKIASGIASALERLHDTTSPPVIYRNLQPSNILLDNNFYVKLGDFGLSKFVPSDNNEELMFTESTKSCVYIAPEYRKRGILTVEADVYSFGLVLLELITGRKAVDMKTIDHNLISWAYRLFKKPKELPDPSLVVQEDFWADGFDQALEFAEECLQKERTARPRMRFAVLVMMAMSSDVCRGYISY